MSQQVVGSKVVRQTRGQPPPHPGRPAHEQPKRPRLLSITSQPLGASEQLFVALRSFTATNVTRVIAIEGLLDVPRLRAALRVLQQRHPLLDVHISSAREPAFVRNERLPLRLHLHVRRDDEHWRALLEELLQRPLSHAPGPLFEVHLLEDTAARRSELFLVGDHSVCDGVSLNALCHELLELCTLGSVRAPRRWHPAFDALLPRFSARQHGVRLASLLLRFARIGLVRSIFERRTAARDTRVLVRELSERETKTLASNARTLQTTITGALMAAAARAVREARPRVPKLALSVPINLRTRIAGHELGPEDLANYTSVAYLQTAAHADTWSLARELKEQLDTTALDSGLLAATPLVYRVGKRFVRANKPPLAHVMLSNSGQLAVRERYGSLHVLNVFSASSSPMLSADFALFCNTLGGRLCINLVFSTQVVSPEEAARVLDRMHQLLSEASTKEGAT